MMGILDMCNQFAMDVFDFMYHYLPLFVLISLALGTLIILIAIGKEIWRRRNEKAKENHSQE
jgi:NADH:ubiquinone oxidoreductase subunit 3 (subunit A)